MATTTLSEFRVDPVSGLKINRTANTLVKWNAFAAVVFLLVGGCSASGGAYSHAERAAAPARDVLLVPDGSWPD